MPVGLARQFQELWESGDPPDVFAFLAQHAGSDTAEKVSVLLVDQQRRWRTDQPLKVEEYLARLPDLGSDPEHKLQLAIGEFQARRQGGAAPSMDEFRTRFSDEHQTLHERLSEVLAGEGGVHLDLTTTRRYITPSTIGDEQIGRYRLVRMLGEGAFGRVYLGFDEELYRQVAIKVPRRQRFRDPDAAAAYLAEARIAASLDHPHIVPVHDVGRTADGAIYVVSKFIEGRSLRDVIQQRRLGHQETARLLATIAQALEHAHQKRLIHRDVKPANLLIEDRTGAMYLADFGLAIREEAYLPAGRITGTPAYMSPEQARGEGHRLDGRSDLFSLGVVFYELLTGKRPFRGSTNNELLHQLIYVDPVPPRELDASIPAELERICLKALSKRVSDRYGTAAALAEDLLHWEQDPQHNAREVKIVPKGLRAFDADDAEFFLDLLPGPRDRDSLPESVRFWKTRIEETDADKTFAVGLVYGPSGCGKSSLVKAGLLPRLSSTVTAVYVEATPGETETRILRGLRKHVPGLPAGLPLAETLALLRRREDGKVLVVLDQFEQWLHARQNEPEAELVGALRQCDGSTLQALVMVRDDFAMAAARFMDALDVPIRQGHNFATVDFFGVEHAEKVLTKFGQAFGKLPDRSSDLSAEQLEFVRAVASSMAQEGKVVSVRLALFAEMVKDKPWVPSTLQQVGGTEGIGVNFLEDTFCSRMANPRHRLHEQAARDVLRALLPDVGTNIKGHMRSHSDLLAAAGYQGRAGEFNDLLRILDGELRLITPTDPEGLQTESGSDPGSKYYQLTHDYLVTPLRSWLTSKQRATRRGRAEIRLDQRTELWTARPERKQLPTLREWLNICLNTAQDRWSVPQRAMMRAASRFHLTRMLLLFALGSLIAGVGGYGWRAMRAASQKDRVEFLVSDLWQTQVEHLPALLAELHEYRSDWEQQVSTVANDPASSPEQRMRGCLALAQRDGKHLDYLLEWMLQADPISQRIVREELRPWQHELAVATWNRTRAPEISNEQLIPAAAILADFAPDDAHWQELAPSVTDALVASDPLLANPWVEALIPVRRQLLPPLLDVSARADSSSSERLLAASVLARYCGRDADLLTGRALADLLLDAEPAVYRILLPVVRQRQAAVLPLARDELRRDVSRSEDTETQRLVARQANAVETLYRMGDVEPFFQRLGEEADPRLRTLLIDRVATATGGWRSLWDRLQGEPNPRARQAIVLGMAGCLRDLSPSERDDLTEKLLRLFRSDPDAGVHSGVQWLLGSLDAGKRIEAETERLAGQGVRGGNWSVEANGLTMVHIPQPRSIPLASPGDEAGPDDHEQKKQISLGYSFAISTCEITLRQFLRYRPSFEPDAVVTPYDDCPVNKISVYDAMKYCRWLSEQEPDFQAGDCCYPPLDEIGRPDMQLPEGYQMRKGYRLPTVAEWEYAARAGSQTSRFFGDSDAHLEAYCWFVQNSNETTSPVGRLRPSPLGLFDVYGNVAEWCHKREGAFDPSKCPLCGGDYRATPRLLRSAAMGITKAEQRLSVIGFRVVKVSGTD